MRHAGDRQPHRRRADTGHRRGRTAARHPGRSPNDAGASPNEFDHYRSFAVNEPRGYDALVGALLCEPEDKTCAAGVIFFNNVGMIGMCGHGTIGLAVTLAHMGRIGPGTHRIETPVGIVSVDLKSRNEVTIENVASYRFRDGVTVDVPGVGHIHRRHRLGRQLVLLHRSRAGRR